MNDLVAYLTENWGVLLLLVAAGLAMAFPRLKPWLVALTKLQADQQGRLKPIDESEAGDDRKLLLAVRAANALIQHHQAEGNEVGEQDARKAAAKLFEKHKSPDAGPKS